LNYITGLNLEASAGVDENAVLAGVTEVANFVEDQ
jgi:hypothetical protein